MIRPLTARLLLLAALLLCSGILPRHAGADPLLPSTTAAASSGEREVKALAAAWPSRIQGAELRDGEWMLNIDGEWFAWAHGRLLPEAQRAEWERFAPLPFYPYPLTLPPLAPLDNAEAARLRALARERLTGPKPRSEAFLSALLQGTRRAGIESRLVKTEVAGFTVKVHQVLEAPLARVSETLSALRTYDPDVAAFLAGLREMNGYNFRNVEGTRSRSLHSYGLAVDLIPRSYGGASAYWLWAMSRTPDWWTIPYQGRWMPPASVVDAFEREGFIWGGKWIFFDTMHFEYRPEVLLLAAEKAAADSAAPSPRG
jgi:hypothetical protein